MWASSSASSSDWFSETCTVLRSQVTSKRPAGLVWHLRPTGLNRSMCRRGAGTSAAISSVIEEGPQQYTAASLSARMRARSGRTPVSSRASMLTVVWPPLLQFVD